MVWLSFILMPRPDRIGSLEHLDRMLAVLRECGYDGVELNITEPFGIDPDDLERLLRKNKLVIPSFLTGEAYAEGLCLCSPDSSIRNRTVQRLMSYLDTAQRFGAILVVGLLQGLRRDEPDPVIANERIVDGLKAFAAAAAGKGVELVIEPVNHLQVGFNNSVAEVLELIRAIGSPAVRPMVDTIHLNIEEQSLTAPIEACGRQLRHVHLCENNGGRFGSGHIDFAAVRETLDRIGYDAFASVKVYRGLNFEEAARSSIDHLRRAGFASR